MNKVNTTFSKILEDIGDFKKALLELPHNKNQVKKALIETLTAEIEKAVLATYDLAE